MFKTYIYMRDRNVLNMYLFIKQRLQFPLLLGQQGAQLQLAALGGAGRRGGGGSGGGGRHGAHFFVHFLLFTLCWIDYVVQITVYPACGRESKGNLMARRPIPYFPPNFARRVWSGGTPRRTLSCYQREEMEIIHSRNP